MQTIKVLSGKDGIRHVSSKWCIGISATDAILEAKLINVELRKDTEPDCDPYELLLEFDNGSELEIYLNCDDQVVVFSD